MMGSGKTTVGSALADRLGRPFFDSDEMIEARTGMTVAQIFRERGEAAFRAEEASALVEAMASAAPAVIAAAGGAVLDDRNRRLIRSAALVVWLQARPAVLATRVGGGSHRPLLDEDPVGTLTRLSGERHALYAGLSDVTVDVDGRPARSVVDLIAEQVGP
jgi:shikimate kinase